MSKETDDLIKKYKGKLNINTLKSFDGYENISEDEKEIILKTVEVMAEILYNCYQKRLIKKEDYG